MPEAATPSPRCSGATHTPWIWQAWGVAAPISALKATLPRSSRRANERPEATSSATRAW